MIGVGVVDVGVGVVDVGGYPGWHFARGALYVPGWR